MIAEKYLWEILVPTVRPDGSKFYTTRFHKVWDKKVRKFSNGLTICPAAKGEWVEDPLTLVTERVIPVRFMASEDEAIKIAEFTKKYYQQKQIMLYLISKEVYFI